MERHFVTVFVLVMIYFVNFANLVPQHKVQLIEKSIDDNLTSLEMGLVQSKCVCVPYYRCDPGHWEKDEDDHCSTRFMYVCCYGTEAVEYLNTQTDDSR